MFKEIKEVQKVTIEDDKRYSVAWTNYGHAVYHFATAYEKDPVTGKTVKKGLSDIKVLERLFDPTPVVELLVDSIDMYKVDGILYSKMADGGYEPIFSPKEAIYSIILTFFHSKISVSTAKSLTDKVLVNIKKYEIEKKAGDIFLAGNKIVNIKDKTIRTHNYPFVPGAIEIEYKDTHSEAIKQEVDQWYSNFGDADKVKAIQEAQGAAFIDTRDHQTMFQLRSEGGAGSSFILQQVIEVLGRENVSTLSEKELHHNFMKSQLLNKQANIGGEVSGGYTNESAVIKAISGGDRIAADVKNSKPISFEPQVTLYFAGNDLIRFGKETNDSLDRRMRIIELSKKQKKDDSVFRKIKQPEYKEYLLFVMLEGAIRYADNNYHLTVDAESADKLEEWKEVNDNVYSFVNQQYGIKDGIIQSELMKDYRAYCAKHTIVAWKEIDVRKSLKKHFGITWKQVTHNNVKDYQFSVPAELTDKWDKELING